MALDQRIPPYGKKQKTAAEYSGMPAAVAGEKQELIEVVYKPDSHFVMNHVFTLRKGVNQVPVKIWEAAEKHPATAALIRAGHIFVAKGAPIVSPTETPKSKKSKDKAPASDAEAGPTDGA